MVFASGEKAEAAPLAAIDRLTGHQAIGVLKRHTS